MILIRTQKLSQFRARHKYQVTSDAYTEIKTSPIAYIDISSTAMPRKKKRVQFDHANKKKRVRPLHKSQVISGLSIEMKAISGPPPDIIFMSTSTTHTTN